MAVNKLDATDPPWSVARYEEVKDQVGTFLETAGFRHDKIRYGIGRYNNADEDEI